MRAGEIVLLRLPQPDLSPGKLRPVLVLSELPGPFGDVLVCGISSQLYQEIPPIWPYREKARLSEKRKRLSGFHSPQCTHGQYKARQHRVAAEHGRIVERLDRLAGAVDVYSFVDGINQPAKARSVIDILLHLVVQICQAIGARAQFHNEVRAEWRKPLSLVLRESVPPLSSHPRGIR